MAERLARTVTEIDPRPRNPYAVAVVLEVLGYTDQRAAEAGWADVFHLARGVFDRIEFLRVLAPPAGRGAAPSQASRLPAAPAPLVAVVTQQMVWLVMVVLMIAWGRSIWSANGLTGSAAEALTAGVLGSLILSGGFQYAMSRRTVFYTSQRDLRRARAFLRWALWVGAACMLAGGAAAALAFLLRRPSDPLAAWLAGAYFVLHGNYRLAVVPLVALNDLAGIALTTGLGVAVLVGSYAALTAAGLAPAAAVPASQLTALAALWLATVARTGDLLREAGTEPSAARAGRGPAALRTRWSVIARDGAPWFAAGLLYYLFLFATRPLAWVLPDAERGTYEAGVDLGLIGIVPVAIAASWALHRYHQALRGLLSTATVAGAGTLRREAARRFAWTLWQCRWFGIAVGLALLALTRGAPWGGMSQPVFTVFRLVLVGLAVVLPGFLFSFGLLTSVGALRDGAAVLATGLALQFAGGVAVVDAGRAGWLALVLVAGGAALSEMAGWRALRVAREIDRFYYAAF
jgi:hypothetical protein